MNKLISVFISLLISSLLVSLLVLSACDERSYTIDEVVTAVMERSYDWETVSTGEGTAVSSYGSFDIGTYRIAVVKSGDFSGNRWITAAINDTAQNKLYIYDCTDGDKDAAMKELKQVIDLSSSDESQHSPQNISVAERWWGMGASYDRASSEKDRSWKVYNARRGEDCMEFDTYVEDPLHEYASEYMELTEQMSALETAVEYNYDTQLPRAVSEIENVTLATIAAVLMSFDLEPEMTTNILEIYSLRDKADSYFDFILDMNGIT